jgi:tRNA threonylcarbamoyladenosine biosynthesis protein TsaB
MSIILSIETSTKVCSVALHQDSSLLAVSEVLVEKSHSKIITVLIDQLLKSSNLDYTNLDAIAVSKGPGSYTGLRIGVSTAKGLCYGLNIPLIGINTLDAMAYEINQYNISKATVCPMLDARRMEVYCALYDSNGTVILQTQAKILDEQSIFELLQNDKIIFCGDGAFKMRGLLNESNHTLIMDSVFPSAKNVGYLASKCFENKQFEDVIYFEPYYLKEFISTKAER